MNMHRTAAGDERRLSYPGWTVVAAAAVALAFGPSTIAVLGLGLFMNPIESEFGWARTQVAMATTIVSYMIVVVSPLQGWLMDRFGVRRVMLPSAPVFALGIAGLALMPNSPLVYYAAWVLIPVLGLGLFPLGYLKAVSSWFKARLGLALGVTNSGVALGGILVPLVAGWLIADYGWRTAYVGLAALVLFLTFPLILLFVREAPTTAAESARAPVQGATFAEAAKTPTFALLIVAFLLLGIINTAVIVHQVPMLVDRGVPLATAALVQTTFGVFGLLGRVVTGLLLDRWRAPMVMAIFTVGGAVACALYAAGVSGGLAFLCSALIGLMFGAEFDVLAYIIKAKFGVRSFGVIYGAIFALFQFGAGCGAALLPIMRDSFGSYGPGMGVFALLLLLSAATILCVRGVPRLSAPSYA
jgi:MFS family permease